MESVRCHESLLQSAAAALPDPKIAADNVGRCLMQPSIVPVRPDVFQARTGLAAAALGAELEAARSRERTQVL